ncbi:MAG TPA: hypothetical protein DCS88_07980 [Alphaproteobacteria bacterium]|nr:hypothetical protein [Alphaproteobacteria bacterium]
MQPDNTATSHHHRRAYERVLFKHMAVLNFVGGKSLLGITRNVSLHGVFLVVTNVPPDVEPGSEALLGLTIANLKKSFPCRVAHIRDNGIGIAFQKKDLDFGTTLTEFLKQKTQYWLGTDIKSSNHLQLTLLDTSTPTPKEIPNIHLIKMSATHINLSFFSSYGRSLRPGDSLDLEIRKYEQTPITLKVVVQSVSTIHPKNTVNADEKNLLCRVPRHAETHGKCHQRFGT